MMVKLDDDTPAAEAPAPTNGVEAPAAEAPAKPKVKLDPRPGRVIRTLGKRRKGKALEAAKQREAKKARVRAAKRKADPAKLDEFGLRKGSLRSQAAAMYSSKRGATLGEVRSKLKSTQFNVLTYLEGMGHKITTKKEDGAGRRPVNRYYLQAR